MFKDGEFTTPYSEEDCSAYVEHLPEAFIHEGRTVHKKEFLETWDEVVRHAKSILGRARERSPPDTGGDKAESSGASPQGSEDATQVREIRVSEGDKYVSRFNNIWLQADTDYLGEGREMGNPKVVQLARAPTRQRVMALLEEHPVETLA